MSPTLAGVWGAGLAVAVQFAVGSGERSFEPLVLSLEVGDFGFVALPLGSELFHVVRRRCWIRWRNQVASLSDAAWARGTTRGSAVILRTIGLWVSETARVEPETRSDSRGSAASRPPAECPPGAARREHRSGGQDRPHRYSLGFAGRRRDVRRDDRRGPRRQPVVHR